MDTGAWLLTVYGVTESDTTEHTRMHTHTHLGDPVVRTPCFRAMDPGTIPGWGSKTLQAAWCGQKINNI